MYTMPITPCNTNTNFTSGTKIVIPSKQNKPNAYLYNIVLDLVREHRVPALFTNKGIDVNFSDSRLQAKAIKQFNESLNSVGINYNKVV